MKRIRSPINGIVAGVKKKRINYKLQKMKKVILLLTIMYLGGVVNAQTQQIKQVYKQNDTIWLDFSKNKPVNAAMLKGRFSLNSHDGLVRILLHGVNKQDILLFEAFYPLYLPADTLDIKFIEELEELVDIQPTYLTIELEDAWLDFKSVKFFANTANYKKEGGKANINYRQDKIKRLNENLECQGYLWRADETIDAESPYSKRTKKYGKNTNTHGAEYYSVGIYSALPYKVKQPGLKSANSSTYIKEWDWRKRHAAHLSTSPYFDGNPDWSETGNGWMTSVKNQLSPGPYTNGCYIFGPVGALEAYMSLYYNRVLNTDLSEQHILSCDGYTGSTTDDPNLGGYVYKSLNFIRDTGVKLESSIPWTGSETSCSSVSSSQQIKCDYQKEWGSKYYNESEMKRKIIEKGPMVASIRYKKVGTSSTGGHSMVLMGYGVVQEGDCLYLRGTFLPPDQDNYRVPANSPLIGSTYWIFKNSNGPNKYNNGYSYYVHDGVSNYFQECYSFTGKPYNAVNYSYSQKVYDKDGDGQSNWGLGPKPSNVSSSIDSDDSDPARGVFDANYYSTVNQSAFNCNGSRFLVRSESWYHEFIWTNITIKKGVTVYVNDKVRLANNATIMVLPGGTLKYNGGSISGGTIINNGTMYINQSTTFRGDENSSLQLNGEVKVGKDVVLTIEGDYIEQPILQLKNQTAFGSDFKQLTIKNGTIVLLDEKSSLDFETPIISLKNIAIHSIGDDVLGQIEMEDISDYIQLKSGVVFETKTVGYEQEQISDIAIHISPNPVESASIISLSGTSGGERLICYNCTGQIVQNIVVSEQSNESIISRDDYGPGIYLLVLTKNGSVVANRKFVVKE